MEIPNLFITIVNKGVRTGFFTLDELAVLRSDPECWKWLTDYLPAYEKYNPILMSVADMKEQTK